MQQFVVPQFIDVEDKIIGPITVRQFIILLLSGGLVFLAWKFADFTLFLFELILIIFFTILFAFVKINGRGIHYFILNVWQTKKRPGLRLWGKIFNYMEIKSRTEDEKIKAKTRPHRKHRVGTSRLAELSLIVDTGGVYDGEQL